MATRSQSPKFYRNLVACGEAHELNHTTMSTILRAAGVRSQPQGYVKVAVDKAVRDYKAGDLKFDGSLKDEKLRREIRLLDIEIETAEGKLANVAEVVDKLTRMHGEMAGRVRTWRESTIAKRPELRREIESIADQLQQELSESIA